MVAKTTFLNSKPKPKIKPHGDMIFIRGLIWNFFVSSISEQVRAVLQNSEMKCQKSRQITDRPQGQGEPQRQSIPGVVQT